MRLTLDCIHAKDLYDRGNYIDVQDPAIVVKVGEEEVRTRRKKHAGTEAKYEEIFVIDIDEHDYYDGKLEIEVEALNKGACGKRNLHIGAGKAVLKTVIPKVDQDVDFSIFLTYYSRKGDLKKGVVQFRGKIFLETEGSETTTDPLSISPAEVEKLEDDSIDQMLVQTFGDVGELEDDFHCAIAGKYLHHGRMYMTSRFILFYSKMFGREKKLKIPFHQITKVSKEQHTLKTDIVLTTMKRRYAFWSFWDTEETFRIIHAYHSQKTKLPRGDSRNSFSSFIDDSVFTHKKSQFFSFHFKLTHYLLLVLLLHPPLTLAKISFSSKKPVLPPCNVDDVSNSGEALMSAATPMELQNMFFNAWNESRHKIIVGTKVVPLSIDEFIRVFVEDGAEYSYKRYHESVRDSNVELTLWNPLTSEACSGMDRELKFFKPVNLPGLASTRGVKLQRFSRYGDSGFLLHSSTRLEDVPAADTFSVDDLVAVKSIDVGSVEVEISFEVVFIKNTFLRRMIEGPTNFEMRKWLESIMKHFYDVAVKMKTPEITEFVSQNLHDPVTIVMNENQISTKSNTTEALTFHNFPRNFEDIMQLAKFAVLVFFFFLYLSINNKISRLETKLDKLESLVGMLLKKSGN